MDQETTDNNPLKHIEDEKAQVDIGVFVARVFKGALQELGDWKQAWWVTVAYCIGLNSSAKVDTDEEEEKDDKPE